MIKIDGTVTLRNETLIDDGTSPKGGGKMIRGGSWSTRREGEPLLTPGKVKIVSGREIGEEMRGGTQTLIGGAIMTIGIVIVIEGVGIDRIN